MQITKTPISHTLPLGNILLDKNTQGYNTKLALLNSMQEIIDDFVVEAKHYCMIDPKLAIVYASNSNESSDNDQSQENNKSGGGIPQIVQEFAELAQDFFEISLLDIVLLENFSGSFGAFSAHLSNGHVVEFAQAVMFVYEEELLRFKGVYNVADFQSADILLNVLRENLGEYSYKDIISYKEDYCQYHHRREKYCAKCVDVCPTFGVMANDSLMELTFSMVDCVSCGACVGVCPTNCLEYDALPKEGLGEIIELYKDQKIFLCAFSDYEKLCVQNVILPESLTPMVLPNLLMLNENDLLAMLQTSGNGILVYGESLSSSMEFLNNITQQIYKKDSIFLVNNVESILKVAQDLPSMESYLYKNRYNKPFRESFAQRLQYIIKEGNFGLAASVVKENGAPVFYGDLKVDSTKCTLCLSCVGACNVNALFARGDDFSLRFNASLCTTCGYCITSCPENVMELSKDGIALNAEYFKSREVARDMPFLCVECGKPFSTQKSIEKVKGMLSLAFSSDVKKLKTIQCCPDCKVKVMFGEG
ncbi:4Fe-4S binding protein [Helicobacter turcicus]|uniref:4Fe-4S binding protein n=1 Tax=Helicobacter turcicus TaxID=2867412 RepID=A0ABS7JPK3_9HELI|nr:4Fe-4S binding protein [Helicobacter turcicus]MBX7491295.1 4Fe-4S binding protein [Helicobacter turcicus]MBX7546218.1 4Fe-4S binding protein [Helicobacter turcicus]